MLSMNTSETLFFHAVIEWSKLDGNIQNTDSVSVFKKINL